jgi:hypothetical protein
MGVGSIKFWSGASVTVGGFHVQRPALTETPLEDWTGLV